MEQIIAGSFSVAEFIFSGLKQGEKSLVGNVLLCGNVFYIKQNPPDFKNLEDFRKRYLKTEYRMSINE